MKNTILKYDTIGSGSFVSQDYTSKQIHNILSLQELSNTDWIEYIELYDNQTVEQISFLEYGTADFWDLLVVINNIDPLFDMSYEFDILEQITNNKVNKYLANYSGVYKQDTFDRLNKLILDEEIAKNEEHRLFKIIKKEKMFDFLNLVKGVKL